MHKKLNLIAASAAILLLTAVTPALAGDTEDSYREGRRQLTRENYARAAELFGQAADGAREAEDAVLTADAMYWSAYALYKMDRLQELYAAAELLEDLIRELPEEAVRGDAHSLALRVEGELARRGDSRYAERMARLAERLEREAERLDRELDRERDREERDHRRHEEHARVPDVPDAPEVSRVPGSPDAPYAPEPPDLDEDLRITALNTLIQVDPERAVPILKKVLADPEKNSVEMRKKAVFIVAQQGTDETEDILLDVVKTDPDVEVQAAAVFWLSQVPGDKSLDALEHILRNSDEPELQEKAVFALSQHPSPRTTAILRDLAMNPNASLEVREQAIFWLHQSGSENTFEFLTGLYHDLEEDELKEKVIFSVSQMGDRRTGTWMLDIAKDTTEPVEMRKKALFWMGQSGYIDGSDLRGLYASMDDREMKEQLIFVLSQMECEDSMDALIEIARTDKDHELREKAVFWIGQSGCDGAVDFLEELIGN